MREVVSHETNFVHGPRWFVVMSKASQEYRASYELLNQGFQTFIPTINLKPMFPRYLFVQFDRAIDPWGKIRSTRGCVDILKSSGIPQPVPIKAMEALMAFEDIPESEKPKHVYAPGERVTVIHGPFSSFEGLFQRSTKGRVEVLLSLFGAQRPVTLDQADIAPAA